MRLKSRLGRLEKPLIGGKGGCRACRHRHRHAVQIVSDELPDGTVVPREPEPEPCPRCGAVPEIIRVVLSEVTHEKLQRMA
jgi:hypothetical protein